MKRLPGANNSINSSVSHDVRKQRCIRYARSQFGLGNAGTIPLFRGGTARSQRYHILIS